MISRFKFDVIVLISLIAFVAVALKVIRAKEILFNRLSNVKSIHTEALPSISLLRSGDLIFRHGRGIISNLLVKFSQRDSRYSHSGIVSIEGNSVYVYHMIGGELNPGSIIKRETIDQFCSPSIAYNFGIYRSDLTKPEIETANFYLNQYYKHKIIFDTKYDLATDSAMYCTEFVYKVVTRAAGRRNYLTLSHLQGLTYVACDDLYLSSHFRKIYSYQY